MGDKISVVVLMAGAGSRFKQAGWSVPKPFIKFEDKMMVEHVLSSFEKLEAQFVLVVQERFLTEQRAELERLTRAYPAKVVTVPKLTMGAAVTALAAHKAVDPARDVVFADSDNIFDPSDICDFISDMRSRRLDAGLLTFPSDDPRYSYAKIDDAGGGKKREAI